MVPESARNASACLVGLTSGLIRQARATGGAHGFRQFHAHRAEKKPEIHARFHFLLLFYSPCLSKLLGVLIVDPGTNAAKETTRHWIVRYDAVCTKIGSPPPASPD